MNLSKPKRLAIGFSFSRTGANSKLSKTLILIVFFMPQMAFASMQCHGRFVNPITDINWKNILPISIGGMRVGKGSSPAKRDTKNPSSPICMCTKNNIPIPGITLGFWEPVSMVDITRTPFCLTNLGGLSVGPARVTKGGSYLKGYDKHFSTHSFYHTHYYRYLPIWILELITDLVCLEKASFDVAYMSEFDPTWNDDKLQFLINPESILFGNPLAQGMCILDCGASTFDLPRDELFWCAGCLGSMYPFSGNNTDHTNGVRSSSLSVARILAKMHRLGLAEDTSCDNAKINGKICKKTKALKIKKSQYKLQMLYPSPTKGDFACFPLGLTDSLYNTNKEYPYDGEDFGYLIWRKRNCCAF